MDAKNERCQARSSTRSIGGERPATTLSARFELAGYELVVTPLASHGANGGDVDGALGGDGGERLVGTLIVDATPYSVQIVGRAACERVAQDRGADELAELLTQRELQIALLVSSGKVNKQIAHQLHISEWTVSTHLRRIFAKLGVHSRAAMAAYVAAHTSV